MVINFPSVFTYVTIHMFIFKLEVFGHNVELVEIIEYDSKFVK